MEEKIKISVPSSIYETLIKDCLDFKIVHSNNKANFNCFLNLLISNYFEDFSSSDQTLNDKLSKIIPLENNIDKSIIINKIIKAFDESNTIYISKEPSKIISFKPTKQSFKAIAFINNHLINNESISSYYRRLLISYCKKIKNEREKIIFKDTYNLLMESIANKVEVTIILKSKTIYKSVGVYDIKSPKDEFYNYVLLYMNNKANTLRLSNISEVILLTSKANIPDNIKILFDKQIKYGVQYIPRENEDQPVKIKLTKNGLKLYEKIYLYRPDYEAVDGDIYTFLGPYDQILHYFKRFGNDAIILEPDKLRDNMRIFYYYGLKAYKKKNNEK